LGELFGVKSDEVEAVLRHDDDRARATLRMQRRGFLGAAVALAAAPFVPKAFIEVPAFEPLAYTMTMGWVDAGATEAMARMLVANATFTWAMINAL
jgi:hypothetical protein